MWAIRVCALALAALGLEAQHTYTSADVEQGGRLYRSTCSVCHGPDGDFVTGIDFGRGKFRRAKDDDDITQIIINGIPNTGMPSNNFTQMQAETIVAYLRSMATAGRGTVTGGDAARGKALFEGKGGCLNCHRVRGNGSRLGPDLTDIGTVRRVAELQQSLLDPDAEILSENRMIRVVTKSGAEFTGRLLNVDMLSLQILDSQERLRSFAKSDLREFSLIRKSPMPSFKDKLSSQELADVISYLVSLKGI